MSKEMDETVKTSDFATGNDNPDMTLLIDNIGEKGYPNAGGKEGCYDVLKQTQDQDSAMFIAKFGEFNVISQPVEKTKDAKMEYKDETIDSLGDLPSINNISKQVTVSVVTWIKPRLIWNKDKTRMGTRLNLHMEKFLSSPNLQQIRMMKIMTFQI
jgi:hypothetical protein